MFRKVAADSSEIIFPKSFDFILPASMPKASTCAASPVDRSLP